MQPVHLLLQPLLLAFRPRVRPHEGVNVGGGFGLGERRVADIEVERLWRTPGAELAVVAQFPGAVGTHGFGVIRRHETRGAVGQVSGLPFVNFEEGHPAGRPEPVQLHHVATQPVDHLQGGQGQLLFDVVNPDVFLAAEMVEEVLVGDGGDAGDAAGAEVHRHAVGFFVIQGAAHAVAAGQGVHRIQRVPYSRQASRKCNSVSQGAV